MKGKKEKQPLQSNVARNKTVDHLNSLIPRVMIAKSHAEVKAQTQPSLAETPNKERQ
jgi:hypothetical protein